MNAYFLCFTVHFCGFHFTLKFAWKSVNQVSQMFPWFSHLKKSGYNPNIWLNALLYNELAMLCHWNMFHNGMILQAVVLRDLSSRYLKHVFANNLFHMHHDSDLKVQFSQCSKFMEQVSITGICLETVMYWYCRNQLRLFAASLMMCSSPREWWAPHGQVAVYHPAAHPRPVPTVVSQHAPHQGGGTG